MCMVQKLLVIMTKEIVYLSIRLNCKIMNQFCYLKTFELLTRYFVKIFETF